MTERELIIGIIACWIALATMSLIVWSPGPIVLGAAVQLITRRITT
jgi:hypothetical protein